MALYQSLVVAYAKAIYIDGTKKFADIRPEYVEAVKQHGAAQYSEEQIEAAFIKGYITEAEYDQTLAYKAA